MTDNNHLFDPEPVAPVPASEPEQAATQPTVPSASGEAPMEPIPEAPKPPIRPMERYKDISGPDRSGHGKAEIFMRHYLHYSDGTAKELEELQIRKPIVNIFPAGGFVNVFLQFARRTDEELNLAFDMVTRYMTTANGVAFLKEEIEQGYYTNEEGDDELVYFPILELALSPRGHETEYMIHGYRPLLYTLVGPNPTADLTTLLLVFKDNLFIVDDHIGPVDLAAVQQDAMEEARMESMGEFDPEDAQL